MMPGDEGADSAKNLHSFCVLACTMYKSFLGLYSLQLNETDAF